MGRAADKYVHPLPPPTVFMATSHSQPSRQLPRAGAPTLLQLHIASGVRMGFVVTHKLLCLDCLCFPPSNVTLYGVRYVLVLLGSGCCVVEKQNNIESSSNLMRKIRGRTRNIKYQI